MKIYVKRLETTKWNIVISKMITKIELFPGYEDVKTKGLGSGQIENYGVFKKTQTEKSSLHKFNFYLTLDDLGTVADTRMTATFMCNMRVLSFEKEQITM